MRGHRAPSGPDGTTRVELRPRSHLAAPRPTRLLAALVALTLVGAACTTQGEATEAFVIGAIPDQEPHRLQRLYASLTDYLERELGVRVEYRPVTDYAASVSLFRVGDFDMVWFGGLTGVQARLQVDGARAILQRDIDETFRSVFIVNTTTGLSPADGISDLAELKDLRFTFGSESSTSGRLMPQYYLARADVTLDDFTGEPGFSGDHDKTIDLVESGTFHAGAVNEHVWNARVRSGEVDPEKVVAFLRTPPYHDYHWVIRPDVEDRYGEDFIDAVARAFLELDTSDPEEARILDLFGTRRFIPTTDDNYERIEDIARRIGLVK